MARIEKPCAQCGVPFMAHNRGAMYCRTKCRDVSQRARLKLLKPKIERACALCGAPFTPGLVLRSYCGPECKKAGRLLGQKIREATGAPPVGTSDNPEKEGKKLAKASDKFLALLRSESRG